MTRAVPAGSVAMGLAVSVLSVLSLAGCGSGSRLAVDPAPDTAAYPVVAVGQAGSVLNAVQGALARPVAAGDSPATVDARLVGPYRELALAQARIAARRQKVLPAPGTVQQLRLIVPVSAGWPRFFVQVGNGTAASTPVLRVLESATARSPYGLWAQATMLPGATLPSTAPDDVGSPMVAAGDSGLVASPAEVLAGFASYLNGGARTTASQPFARSVYSDQLIQRLAVDRKALAAVATVSSSHTVGPDGPLAVRTEDGGALVVGELQQKYLVTVKKGKGSVKVSDRNLAALAGGRTKFDRSFTRTAVEVVVFAVPPRGKGLITVIAAQKGDVGAVAK